MALKSFTSFFSKIRRSFKRYKPKKYWEKRGERYNEEVEETRFKQLVTPLQQRVLARFLERVKPTSILEVGCGTGRMFAIYDGAEVIGLDFSSTMIKHAKKVRTSKASLILASALNIPLRDRVVDCTITCETLMHIPHNQIAKAAREISRTSKTLICLEYFENRQVSSDPHCFLHDYPKLFRENSFALESSFDTELRQTCFLFRKQRKPFA